jgi:protein dithiol:quinone oxidoreductase
MSRHSRTSHPNQKTSSRGFLILPSIVVISLTAVGIALISQYQFELRPCAWCVLQRFVFILLAVGALIGTLCKPGFARSFWAAITAILALSGAAAAAYQHWVAAKSSSCAFSLADKILSMFNLEKSWPSVFEVQATCADAAVTWWGLPFEFWSLGLFGLLALMGLLAMRPRSPQ